MFRALSLDLQGRIPTRAEVASFEKEGFDLDGWIDARLGSPAYAERLRRVYLDALRLQIGRTFQFVPGATTLRRYEVLTEDGQKVVVYFRKGQRRADPLTDGEFCLPKGVTGQTYPSNAAAVGEPKPVPLAALDQATVKVKPWWLYQDYTAKSPSKRYGDGWGGEGSDFQLAPALAFEADGTTPVTEIRVCKEEASTAETGTVYATGLTKKPATIPEGRFTFPPLDSGFAQKNGGKPISCSIGSALANSADCGCGVGLERCMPGESHSFEPAAFLFPSHAQLGDDTAFDSSKQSPGAWWRYWWGQEAVRFLDHLFAEDRDFREVLTSPTTFVNGPLTRFYRSVSRVTCCGNGINLGYTDPEPLFDPKVLPPLLPHQGATWQKVESRGPRASGLLTMPVFLTKYGSRRARAHVLYTAFLCREFVAENVELAPSEEPDLTKRPGCSSCHVALEPMAAYFSRVSESDWTYLPEGAFPTVNPTCKLDSKGAMSTSCRTYYDPAFSDATAGELRGAHASPANAAAGPAGLAAVLTGSPEFASCAVENVASSFLGRPLGVDDEALKQQLTAGFKDGGFRMKKLVAALVKSRAYREANNLNSDAWRASEAP
jgi:hypothetical protein